MESNKKTLAKTVTWRIAHLVVGMLVTFLLTHSVETSAEIVSAEIVWETALYYIHERGWSRFGSKVK